MAWQIPIANTNGVTDLGTTSNLYVAKPIVIGGVIASGSNQQVIVDGTIASFGDGIRFSGGSSTTFGNRITVNADGVVRGFGGTGILTSCYDTTIINKGYVFGGSNGVQLNGISGTTTSTLENSGTIESDHYGVARRGGSTETISIVNTGTISGAQFSFGQFNGDSVARDLITNKGMMIGNINLGGGNDLYDGRLGTVIGDVLGGDGIDQINTDAGNNKLFGEAGNDTLMGGAGGDFLNGGAGDDLASYAFATAGVIANLLVPATNTGDAAGDTYDSIEWLAGSSHNDQLYGNNLDNRLAGGAGNDVLRGLLGNDLFWGQAGKDIFLFNTALNTATNVDRILDFAVIDDTIYLENAIFTALGAAGALAATAFKSNATGLAGDASDRIIYETDTGKLFYDADGNAAGFAGVHFATLTVGLALTAADFLVI